MTKVKTAVGELLTAAGAAGLTAGELVPKMRMSGLFSAHTYMNTACLLRTDTLWSFQSSQVGYEGHLLSYCAISPAAAEAQCPATLLMSTYTLSVVFQPTSTRLEPVTSTSAPPSSNIRNTGAKTFRFRRTDYRSPHYDQV